MSARRTITFRLAPELAAYVAWLNADPRRTFDVAQYDLFRANYRAPVQATASSDGAASLAPDTVLGRMDGGGM